MRRKLTLLDVLVLVACLFFLLTIFGDIAWLFFSWPLVTGWWSFIARTWPRMEWTESVVTGLVVYVVVFGVGVHLFLRWLYGSMGSEGVARRWRIKWTVGWLAVVMLLFLAGTAMVGVVHQTGWLVSGPRPMFTMERANRVHCASNLRQIGQAIELHAKEHGGRLPEDLAQLVLTADLSPNVFVCRSSEHVEAMGETREKVMARVRRPEHCSYVYVGAGMTWPVEAERVVAYELERNHDGAGMNVLFGNGHVEWFTAEQARMFLASGRDERVFPVRATTQKTIAEVGKGGAR